jgi:predicted Zn-dependent protease
MDRVPCGFLEPRASQRIANRIGAAWEFSRLVFASEDGSLKVDLAPEPKRLALPNTNITKVYLVPLGLSKDESIAWAPTFYRAKFGLDVEVLPGTPLTTKEMDMQRKQIVAEECAEALIQSHPDLSRDPTILLVGVTSHDMFIRSFDWKYSENYRENGHVAVLSSARLYPTLFLQKRNPELLAARLQKLLSKNLAILAFNLPMSSDYTSMLSGGVLSGDELDFMSGDIVGAEGRWDSFIHPSGPGLGVVAIPGKKAFWQLQEIYEPLLDMSSDVFDVDFATGLFISRKSDFYFDDEFPLQFVRIYNSSDNQSRAFGVGTLHSLDIFFDRAHGRVCRIDPSGRSTNPLRPRSARVRPIWAALSCSTGLQQSVFSCRGRF